MLLVFYHSSEQKQLTLVQGYTHLCSNLNVIGESPQSVGVTVATPVKLHVHTVYNSNEQILIDLQ